MGWGNKFPDMKNDPSYLEGRLSNAETSLAQKAQQTDLNTTNANVALKADKAYVDNKVAGSVSGAPIPVSLVANMTDHTRNYVYTGTESGYTAGHWYWWNGLGAWVDGGIYQSTGITNGSILPIQTSFFVQGKNLFNKDTVNKGYYLNGGDGSLVVSSAYNTSDYIAVTANSQYVFSPSCFRIAFYNSSKAYISYIANPTNPITTPANTAYIRYSFTADTTPLQQFEVGSAPTSYERYSGFTVTQDSIKNDSIDVKKILGAIVGKNKLNKDTCYPGYLNPTDYSIVASAGYTVSDFIPLTAGSSYICTNVRSLVYYDTNKTAISGVDNPSILTVPVNAAYARVSVDNTYLSVSAQIETGTTRTTYEAYKRLIPLSLIEPFKTGSPYDQSLNTTDDVTFHTVKTTGTTPTGTLASPPVGLNSGDVWADTTDSSIYPILRVKL